MVSEALIISCAFGGSSWGGWLNLVPICPHNLEDRSDRYDIYIYIVYISILYNSISSSQQVSSTLANSFPTYISRILPCRPIADGLRTHLRSFYIEQWQTLTNPYWEMATPGFSAGIAASSDIWNHFCPAALATSWPSRRHFHWRRTYEGTPSTIKASQYSLESNVDCCRYNSRAFVSSFLFHPLFPSVPFPPTLPLLPLDLDSLVGRTGTDIATAKLYFCNVYKTSNLLLIIQ